MILIRPWIPVFRWDTGTTFISQTIATLQYPTVTHYYAASHQVVWSVGLPVTMSVCHTSEPRKNGWNDQVAICIPDSGGPNEPRITRSRCQHGKGQFWGENRQTIVKYRDIPRSSVQRRLNRSRCCLGCRLAWAQSIKLHGRSRSHMGRGNSSG